MATTASNQVTLLGGSGFVGTALCAQLQRMGYRIKIITRNISSCRSVTVLPSVEICVVHQFDQATLSSVIKGSHAVINLIGILNEKGHSGKGFFQAHTEIAQQLLRACQDVGVRRLLHMSALNASPEAPSNYLRSKGQAENYLLTFAGDRTDVTLFCPSVIFGPGDSFVNRFAQLLKVTPVLPLACPNSRFAPVYVGDVVNCMIDNLNDPSSYQTKISLCGPRTYTLYEIVRYIADQMNIKRTIIKLPRWASKFQAHLFEYVPGKPFSIDNFQSLQQDSICTEGTPCKHSLEAIVPQYLSATHHRPPTA